MKIPPQFTLKVGRIIIVIILFCEHYFPYFSLLGGWKVLLDPPFTSHSIMTVVHIHHFQFIHLNLSMSTLAVTNSEYLQ